MIAIEETSTRYRVEDEGVEVGQALFMPIPQSWRLTYSNGMRILVDEEPGVGNISTLLERNNITIQA